MAGTLEVLNLGLLIAGAAILIAVAASLIRSGRWRNPLADTEVPVTGPGIGAVLIAVAAFVTLHWAVAALAGLEPSPSDSPPGSSGWHRGYCADAVVSLLLSGLMTAMLVAARRTELMSQPVRRARGLKSAAAGVLVLLPVTTLQSEAGRVVWSWLRPDVAPPIHPVLQALTASEWGKWGALQLVVSAVLIAPLTEELFFRGLLLQAVCYHFRHGWLAIALSGTAFGLVHAQPQDVLPLVSMGVVLGYVRLRCGVLWPCILLHGLFNARTMLLAILAPELLRGPGGPPS